MATEPPRGRRRFVLLLLSVVLAIGLSVAVSFAIVASQNPSAVKGPAFVYGSPPR